MAFSYGSDACKCPQCGQWGYGNIHAELCDDCHDLNNPLIKDERGFYVMRSYRVDRDDNMPCEKEHREDVNAQLPNIQWDTHREKWKVEFTAPDLGGYDAFTCVWWFDNKEDIIKTMEEWPTDE